MLCAPKSKVREQYALNVNALREGNLTDMQIEITTKVKDTLYYLFGSKCLPDEETNYADFKVPEPKCKHFKDGKCAHPAVSHLENGKLVKGAECDVSSCEDVEYEPNLAEPRFKVGDKVRLKDVYEIEEIDEDSAMVGLKGCAYMEDIDNLEPYTEPKEEADKQFDNILKDSFAKERRLNIAAMVMASIMGSNDWSDYSGATDEDVWRNMAKASLGVADALIAECEKKGGSDEKD